MPSREGAAAQAPGQGLLDLVQVHADGHLLPSVQLVHLVIHLGAQPCFVGWSVQPETVAKTVDLMELPRVVLQSVGATSQYVW